MTARCYQVSCGWYGGPTVGTYLCTPDLALAQRLVQSLHRQGYDWCTLYVSTVPLGTVTSTLAIRQEDR